VKAGPTSVLAQVSQNLSIRELYCNLLNPEHLCEAVLEECSQQTAGSDYSTQLSTGQRSGRVLSPVLCFLVQERHKPPGTSPVEGPPGWSKAGASDVEEEVEAASLF